MIENNAGAASNKRDNRGLRVLCVFSNPGSWGEYNIIAGGEIRTVEILKRWHEWGVQVESMETVPSPSQALGGGYNVHTISLPFKGYRALTLLVNTLILFYKYLRAIVSIIHKFDVVVTSTSNLLDVAPAWFMNKFWGKPFAVVVQVSCYSDSLRATYRLMRDEGEGVFHSIWMALTARIALRLARKSSVLFCLSRPIAEILLKLGFKPETVHVTGMGLDHAAINSAPQHTNDYDVVFLGRTEKHKGVQDLIDAWRIVSGKKPGVRLLVVGAGTFLDEAKRQVSTSDLSSNVLFVGFVGSPEKFSYLKSSRIFVYPSKINEGWGLAIAEALACGLPVICTDNPVFKRIFGQCSGVAFTPVNDPEALAAAILDFLKDDVLLKTRGEAAKAYAQQYNWDAIAKMELAIIKDSVSRKDNIVRPDGRFTKARQEKE